MILRPQLEPTDEQSILNYYTEHYEEVYVVSCNKCKADLGIEVKGHISGYPLNRNGYTMLAFGSNLLTSRVRTDGSMGYQCICGNDTRGTEIEEALSPDGTFLPHEVAAIEQKQIEVDWQPKVKVRGNREITETFTRERIK